MPVAENPGIALRHAVPHTGRASHNTDVATELPERAVAALPEDAAVIRDHLGRDQLFGPQLAKG